MKAHRQTSVSVATELIRKPMRLLGKDLGSETGQSVRDGMAFGRDSPSTNRIGIGFTLNAYSHMRVYEPGL